MIKYYCDRCGKECQTLRSVKIPFKREKEYFQTKTINACLACEKEANDLYDKISDIRFVMFRDFMKEGVTDEQI